MQKVLPADRIKVMIIDDSASVRAILSHLIAEDPGLEMIETAADPFEAAEKMRNVLPDVLLLDLNMPKMDGLTFLKKIMTQRPMPVVVVSSHAREGSNASLRALELGAAEVICKPNISNAEQRREAALLISDAIRAANQTRASRRKIAAPLAPGPRHTADVILPSAPAPKRSGPPIIAIGASTGGTEALRALMEALPDNLPPIAIVQHMPQTFTHAFATRLNGTSAVEIFEATDGVSLSRGQAVIAQGDRHMMVRRAGDKYRMELADGPPVARHRPSVDVMFRSVMQSAGSSALGILLTGMGDDGARGLGELYGCGAQTIAESEESCVVFGMPRAAIERGAAGKVVRLDRIAREIVEWAQQTVQVAK